MDKPRKPEAKAAPPVESLPQQSTPPKNAGEVKGGAMRRGGDDDLDDLEVER